jgi:hypothetical protein
MGTSSSTQLIGDGVQSGKFGNRPHGEAARIRGELPDPLSEQIEDEIGMPSHPLR